MHRQTNNCQLPLTRLKGIYLACSHSREKCFDILKPMLVKLQRSPSIFGGAVVSTFPGGDGHYSETLNNPKNASAHSISWLGCQG